MLTIGTRCSTDPVVHGVATRLGWEILPAGISRVPSIPGSVGGALIDIPADSSEARRLFDVWEKLGRRGPLLGILWEQGRILHGPLQDAVDDVVRSSSLSDELETRIRLTVARHRRQLRLPALGRMRVNISQRTIAANGAVVRLSLREFQVFVVLAQHLGEVTTRSTIYREVWGERAAPRDERIVDVYIGYLRRRLHGVRHDTLLRTFRGIGYSLSSPDSERG